MHGGGGHVVVLLVLALICCGGLIDVGRRGLAAHRGGSGGKGPKAAGGFLAHRRALRLERTRHENAKVRDEAKHKHRLAEQEAARQAKAADGGGPRGGTIRATAVRIKDATTTGKPKPAAGAPAEAGPVPPQPSGSSASPAQPADADAKPEYGTRLQFRPVYPPKPPAAGPSPSPAQPAQPQEPPARNGTAPAAAAPAPGPAQSPTIEGVVMTDYPGALSVPGVEMIIEGAAAVHRHMLSGNARAKLAGVRGIEAAEDALAGTIRALARDMAEPGQHYGPEVTDPLAMSATHLAAGSLALSEVEGRIAAVVRASEELAAAGVQAPHHSEFADGERLEPGGGGHFAPGVPRLDGGRVVGVMRRA